MSEELENVDSPEIVSEETDTTEAQEPQKSNLQTRIDTITRQKYEALQETDLLKKQNAECRRK